MLFKKGLIDSPMCLYRVANSKRAASRTALFAWFAEWEEKSITFFKCTEAAPNSSIKTAKIVQLSLMLFGALVLSPFFMT